MAEGAGPVADTQRLDSLTGLRIFAAGAVFLSHLGAPQFAPEPVRAFFGAGYIGVTLFFVLSGFVLAWNYVDRLATGSPRAVWSFAVARFARIYPLYLFVLLWVAVPAISSHALPAGSWLHVLAVQTWSPNLSVAFALNGPGWSIGVEFFLYACFPLLAVPLARLRNSTGALVALLALAVVMVIVVTAVFAGLRLDELPWEAPSSDHRWLYRTPVTRLGDFVVGAVLAVLVRRVSPPGRLCGPLQVGAVIMIAGLMATPSLLFTVWSWDAVYLVPVAVLLWSLAGRPRSTLARFLAFRPLVLAGEASYAFYLLHAPMIERLRLVGQDSWLGFAAGATSVFVMILLLAVGAHVVIERPAQLWLRRVLDRRREGGRGAVRAVPEQRSASPAVASALSGRHRRDA